jgi:hypothetical protein
MIKLINKYCVFEYDSKNVSIFARNMVDNVNEPCIMSRSKARVVVFASDVASSWKPSTSFSEVVEKVKKYRIKVLEFNAKDTNDTNDVKEYVK